MLTSEISDPIVIRMLSESEVFEYFNLRISDSFQSKILTSEISDPIVIIKLSESGLFEHFNLRFLVDIRFILKC